MSSPHGRRSRCARSGSTAPGACCRPGARSPAGGALRHYGREHLARLELIEELQRQGLTLTAIERCLERLPAGVSARDLAVHRAVVSARTPDAVETVSREELARRAGRALEDDAIGRPAAMGVIRSAGDGEYQVDLALFRLGVRLLDAPLSRECILAAREVLLAHSRRAARELSALLRGETAGRDARSLPADTRSLVVQAMGRRPSSGR